MNATLATPGQGDEYPEGAFAPAGSPACRALEERLAAEAAAANGFGGAYTREMYRINVARTDRRLPPIFN